MNRWLTLAAALGGGGLFAGVLPLEHLADALQPMITALSIMMAAVLVRLNRGMPTLDWKTIEPAGRRGLTAAIVNLTGEYATITAILGVCLLGCLGLLLVGKTALVAITDPYARVAIPASVGLFAGLGLARMAYVVWRDVDVVRLQRKIIDDASFKDEAAVAEAKVASIRTTLRTNSNPPPRLERVKCATFIDNGEFSHGQGHLWQCPTISRMHWRNLPVAKTTPPHQLAKTSIWSLLERTANGSGGETNSSTVMARLDRSDAVASASTPLLACLSFPNPT